MKSISIYIIGLILGFIIFLFFFQVDVFYSMSIIFYRGLAIILVMALIEWTILTLSIIAFFKNDVSHAHAFSATMMTVAISVVFLVVIPVTLDRSVSVFLLSYMSNYGKEMHPDELEDVLVRKYIKEYHAVDRRVNEQIKSGNISKTPDGKLVLTPQGSKFLFFSRKIAKYFGIDMKYLDPSLQ